MDVEKWLEDNGFFDIKESVNQHRFETFEEYEREYRSRCHRYDKDCGTDACPLKFLAIQQHKSGLIADVSCGNVVRFVDIGCQNYSMEYLDQVLNELDQIELSQIDN